MSSNRIRVAITGIGMVTPLGHDCASTWKALFDRQSGIDTIRSFDASGFPCHIAAEVKGFVPEARILNKKLLRYAIPSTSYALAASTEAMLDAGIAPTKATASRWGLVVGSGLMTASFEFMMLFHQRFGANGELDIQKLGQKVRQYFSPYDFGRTQTNCGLALLLKQHNILGYATSVHTACASGGQALGLGMQALRRGDADYVLAGGFDSMINPIGLAGFCLLGALATDNDTPARASRPFDLTRQGFVLAEGAAFMVLEKWEDAKRRNAKIYAELAGEGNSLSCYRITDSHPSGDGAIQAIQGALSDARINPHEINYINAHGTSTKMNDISETNAIKALFQNDAYRIPVSSTKSQTGHLISAAGALEGAFCALSIHHAQIPMTMNLTRPDPECDLDYVSDAPRSYEVTAALSNSFGFGGSNSCLVFKHPDWV